MTECKIPFLLSSYYIVSMLYSLHAYMFWHIDNTILAFVILSLTLIIHFLYTNFFGYQCKMIALLAIVAVLFGTHGNVNGYVFNVINLFPFLSFLFLYDEYKYSVFALWRKAFWVVILFSLIAYLIALAGVNLPYFPDFYGDINKSSYYLMYNYVFFVEAKSIYTGVVSDRFCSIFLEPGYLACLIVMLFFIDGFKFKERKSNYVLFIALLFTFSVAGYLLFIVFYMIRVMKNSRYLLVSIVGLFTLISSIYLYGTFYNDGDNDINHRVLERLEYDEKRGTVEGYNRTTKEFDAYFDEFFFSSKVLMGDVDEYNVKFAKGGPNVGIKYYISVYGLLGLFSYVLFLFSPIGVLVRKSYFSLSFLGLWLIIFARGNFVMWMSAFLITYIYGLYALNIQDNYNMID